MYNAWPNDTRIFVGHDYPPAKSHRSVSTMRHKQKKWGDSFIHDKTVRGDDYTRSSQAIQYDGE